MDALAQRLGVDPDYVCSAFEDPLYYLQRERQLPVNVDPVDNRLDDPEERERLRRVFERGLETPVGLVLPLKRSWGRNGPEWQTGLWMLRGQHIFLIPGDSPVGLRLPLSSLPWVAAVGSARSRFPSIRWRIQDRCPMPRRVRAKRWPAPAIAWSDRSGTASQSPANPRPGSFAPPCASNLGMAVCTSSCRRLTKAETISTCSRPSRIRPPHLKCRWSSRAIRRLPDWRLRQIKVTPDPGVIEVNVHPAANWSELVANTTAALRRRAAVAPGHREVHAGWPAHRHRRRQSFCVGRAHAGRQPVPAASRSVAQHDRLLAQSSFAVLCLFDDLHRAHQPSAARRRDSPGQSL